MELNIAEYEDAVAILRRYAYLRNRSRETRARHIVITDDHAAALLFVLEGSRLHGVDE